MDIDRTSIGTLIGVKYSDTGIPADFRYTITDATKPAGPFLNKDESLMKT